MKILVAYVPAGAGHQRAAEAVAAAFHQLQVSAEVTVVDALDGVSRFYRWVFTEGYLRMIHQVPFLWGLLYHLTDIRAFQKPVEWIHRTSNRDLGRGFEAYLQETQPDIVIGTHFFPMETAGALKAQGKISSRLITVITDYMPHALWITPRIDDYVVVCERTRRELITRGVPDGIIHILGIPVDLKFAKRENRAALIRQMGLDPDRFTILVGSGGAGTGPILSLVTALGTIREPVQLMVVTGRNTHLFQRLAEMRHKFPHPVKMFGFINNMDELMEASDLVVSKPGGLTCTEALAKGVPLVLTAAIPGQETRNARILVEMGAAVLDGNIREIPKVVARLINDRGTLERMARAAKTASRPFAAADIVKLAIDAKTPS